MTCRESPVFLALSSSLEIGVMVDEFMKSILVKSMMIFLVPASSSTLDKIGTMKEDGSRLSLLPTSSFSPRISLSLRFLLFLIPPAGQRAWPLFWHG